MKAYFLVRDSIPTGWAILAAAHAAVKMLEEFRSEPDTQLWLQDFRKVLVRVSDRDFEKAKLRGLDFISFTDDDFDPNQEMVLAFRPQRHWPSFFRGLKLYE